MAREIRIDEAIQTRVIDLRWLAPLPKQSLKKALEGTEKVLIVDECRQSGNISEALMAFLHEETDLPHSRIASEDSFIATGPAFAATMPSKDSITQAARDLWRAS